MERTETYLGDGLYASFDGYQIILRAPRPEGDHTPPMAAAYGMPQHESKTTPPWHPAKTAPENGTEIEYRCAGSARIRQGSACHDFGGSFRFPSDMTEWRYIPGSPEAIVEAEFMTDKHQTTAGEADAAGRAAYHAGQPCEAPDYGREDRRARWCCGWKREQAASGQRTAIRDLAVRMAQELDVNVDRAEAAARNLIARGMIELVEARNAR